MLRWSLGIVFTSKGKNSVENQAAFTGNASFHWKAQLKKEIRMITRLIIEIMKNDARALTKDELMPRYIVLIVFLLVDVWLILLILRRLKQKRMKTITALILSAVLVFEAAQVFPFLQAEKEVPLEYVCSVETTRNDPLNNTIKWYTDCSVIDSEPVEKEVLESCLECDLTETRAA